MKVVQETWTATGWSSSGSLRGAQLVLVFGERRAFATAAAVERARRQFPNATIVCGSTAGEICGTRVLDDSVVVTAIEFAATRVRAASIRLSDHSSSFAAGASLASSFDTDGLRHLFVLSDGLRVNGSELVRGLSANLPASVGVTGGLCGDGDRFERTAAGLGDDVADGNVAAVGFYGDALRVGAASLGGWDPFGPERLITRSTGNVLHELEGRAALDLYREYLGSFAADLPASGLRFPLSLRTTDGRGVVRTILSVDDENGSITFAGDVPEGAYARLMKANFDRLIEGAHGAAEATQAPRSQPPALAILISCVGRKLVLKQRVEEEVEAVREVFGADVPLAGFYSYGEISPFTPSARCELHNQTMTITTLTEAA